MIKVETDDTEEMTLSEIEIVLLLETGAGIAIVVETCILPHLPFVNGNVGMIDIVTAMLVDTEAVTMIRESARHIVKGPLEDGSGMMTVDAMSVNHLVDMTDPQDVTKGENRGEEMTEALVTGVGLMTAMPTVVLPIAEVGSLEPRTLSILRLYSILVIRYI